MFIYEGHRSKKVANACSCLDRLLAAIFIGNRQMAPQCRRWSRFRLEGNLVNNSVLMPYAWPTLPVSVTSAPSLAVFRSRLKSHLFERSFPAYSY